jgi:hypothetical protein
MIKESFTSILPQEARTPAVLRTVVESLQKRLAVNQSVKRTRHALLEH